METFLYGLATLAIGAVTFIAYYHPTSYGRYFYYPLLVACMLGEAFFLAYSQAIVHSSTILVDATEKAEPSTQTVLVPVARNVLALVPPNFYFLALILLWLYLTFLLALPALELTSAHRRSSAESA